MASHFFYNVARKIIVQVLDIFNGIKIAKYNSSGEIEAYVAVPLVFAPKSKQWWFQKSSRNVDGLTMTDNVYPTMAVSMVSMDFAKDRMVNNLQKIIITHEQNSILEHLTPIPYDYNFTLEIVAEHFIDIIQIIEQVVVWFNPHVVIRVTIPELNIRIHPDKDDMNEDGSHSLEVVVSHNGLTLDAPVDIDLSNIRLLKWNFEFTAKGYLFQPIKQEPFIKKIIHDTYMDIHGYDGSLGTPPVSGNQVYQDIISSSELVKYDDDVRILFKYERVDNK